MKVFGFLIGLVVANPMMNFLLMDQLSEDGESDSLMKMLLFSPGLLGQNQAQGDQMTSLLPFRKVTVVSISLLCYPFL